MVDISIVDGGYKLTYNWGVPHCNGYDSLMISRSHDDKSPLSLPFHRAKPRQSCMDRSHQPARPSCGGTSKHRNIEISMGNILIWVY